MATEPSNASTERVLALLLLLMQEDASREDIFARIVAYDRDSSPESQRRMLDRDLTTIERAGICIERKNGCYWVTLSQFERKVRALEGETMHPIALDRPLLMWIPWSKQ